MSITILGPCGLTPLEISTSNGGAVFNVRVVVTAIVLLPCSDFATVYMYLILDLSRPRYEYYLQLAISRLAVVGKSGICAPRKATRTSDGTCRYTGDGECDDGSTGGTAICPAGSDAADCAGAGTSGDSCRYAHDGEASVHQFWCLLHIKFECSFCLNCIRCCRSVTCRSIAPLARTAPIATPVPAGDTSDKS